MTNHINDLITQYSNILSSIEFHRSAVESEQGKARELLTTLFAEIGKEPFKVNGREVAILVRRGVIQTMPTTRVSRKERKKKVVESITEDQEAILAAATIANPVEAPTEDDDSENYELDEDSDYPTIEDMLGY